MALAGTATKRRDTHLIARCWRGWTTRRNAETYAAHFQNVVVPHLVGIDGYRGARLLRRTDGDEVSYVAITYFDSMDAIHAFAGPDAEMAVVDPAAQQALSRFEDRCEHYTVAASDDRLP